jgi:hypothetical protein
MRLKAVCAPLTGFASALLVTASTTSYIAAATAFPVISTAITSMIDDIVPDTGRSGPTGNRSREMEPTREKEAERRDGSSSDLGHRWDGCGVGLLGVLRGPWVVDLLAEAMVPPCCLMGGDLIDDIVPDTGRSGPTGNRSREMEPTREKEAEVRQRPSRHGLHHFLHRCGDCVPGHFDGHHVDCDP